MKSRLVSIIVPVFNEAENIYSMTDRFVKLFSGEKLFEVEFVFVDDGSSDDSFKLLTRANYGKTRAKVIKLSRNVGSHAAVRAGVLNSSGDVITFMAADLQDPPELPIELFKKIEEGYDIVWAQRKIYSRKIAEKIFSEWYSRLMQRFAFKEFPRNGVDCVMFNTKVKNQVNLNIEANSSILLQIMGLGFRQGYIEYEKGPRKLGASKWTLSKKMKLVIDSFVSFSYFPIRMVTITGLAFFFIGIAWAVYIGMRKIIFNDTALGWPMLSSILLLGFGITNISLGIIAEYLWRTLDASRKRPVFIVDEIIELNQK